LTYIDAGISGVNDTPKNYGFSVRCCRDV